MPSLISNIPHFKCWVRREFTANHQKYHGEFLHAIAFAVNTIPDRSLSFQVVFTGCETEYDDWEEEDLWDYIILHGSALRWYTDDANFKKTVVWPFFLNNFLHVEMIQLHFLQSLYVI